MKTPKDKAIELVEKYNNIIFCNTGTYGIQTAKRCALIAVENEYHSLREQLFNLRSSYVIESAKVYLYRLEYLIDEEQQVKAEIEKL